MISHLDINFVRKNWGNFETDKEKNAQSSPTSGKQNDVLIFDFT